MKKISKKFIFFYCLLPFIFISTVSLQAQVPEPDSILEIAIYYAVSDTLYDLPDGMVNYNVTDPGTISTMFLGIEADTLRDCSDLESDCDCYLYIKFTNASRLIYQIFYTWTVIAEKGDRGNCYYIRPPSQSLFQLYAQ
ncbi:MAG: hypothetical protein GY839_19765 [candidate division Zixibacteria bacterium]|nr:hypothetical protein [candidate division Zixibacteria bacterium]